MVIDKTARPREAATKFREPVSHEVIRELRASYSRARGDDLERQGKMGLDYAAGTDRVGIRYVTLEYLLDQLEVCDV